MWAKMSVMQASKTGLQNIYTFKVNKPDCGCVLFMAVTARKPLHVCDWSKHLSMQKQSKLACLCGKKCVMCKQVKQAYKKYIHSKLTNQLLAVLCLCQYQHGNNCRFVVEVNICLCRRNPNLSEIICTKTSQHALKLSPKKICTDKNRPNFGTGLVML